MENRIAHMEEKLEDLSEGMEEMKGMMAQVREAIMGNPVAGDKGLAGRLSKLEQKIEKYDSLMWWVIGLATSVGFSANTLIDKFIK